MLEELLMSSKILSGAVERYANACFAVEGCSISQPHLDHLAREIASLSACTSLLGKAKAALGRSQNKPWAVISINSLPAETLLLIFDILYNSEGCSGQQIVRSMNKSGGHRNHHSYPDILSHVCSRWRKIVTNTQRFWSHIDIIPHRPFSQAMLSRAELYVNRNDQAPLDIHITDTDSPFLHRYRDASFLRFIHSIAKRTQSIDLVSRCVPQAFYATILESFFTNAVPGMIKDIRLSDEAYPPHIGHVFLESSENPRHENSLLLDVPEQQFEDLLRPVTVLFLRGLHPHWSSHAYHGLSELYIVSIRSARPSMTKLELVKILTSSPHLKILHLNVKLTGSLPLRSTRVLLEQLEVLNLQSLQDDELSTVLRLLDPGPNPLHFALTLPHKRLSLSLNRAIRQFFTRANIFILLLDGSDTSSWLSELLDSSPNIQYLSTRSTLATEICVPPAHATDCDPLAVRPCIEELCMRESAVVLEDLERMLQRYRIHTLSLWNCNVRGRRLIDTQEIITTLSHHCSVVKVLGEKDGDPTSNW